MQLATQRMFLCNTELYKQIDGVAMGSPLGCTLANFFLGHLETVIFKQPSSTHPKMYLRYVDDVFAVFDDDKKCDSFLNILNTQHKYLQFTVEKSAHTLQFSDVNIKVNEQDVDAWVWRKPTSTGLFLNLDAICSLKWKSGLIICMLHRAKMICSNDNLFFAKVNKLRSLFLANNYTNNFFNKILKQFLDSFSCVTTNCDDDSDKHFVNVPYVGAASKQFVKQLSELVKCKFGVEICAIYISCKVGRCFQLKSVTPITLSSNVVYQFLCSCDTNLSFVGMSSRHLETRARKHLNLADIDINSDIKDHLYDCDKVSSMKHSVESFKILKKCVTEYDTKIQEAL